jgi:AcrR family transcriptional regulator
MLELMRAGDVSPGAELVADRARVGLRTVFRHFKDMDSLYREMAHVIAAELREVASRPFKAETGRDRILELIERRSHAYEKIAPFKSASDAHRHRSPFLAAHDGQLAMQSREILTRLLPEDLARDATKLEALDLLLSYEAWSRLRREQGLTPHRAREVLDAEVRRVLDG